MTPRRAAWATASVRPVASNLSRSEPTWNLAVWTDIPSCRAMVLFDAPSATTTRPAASWGAEPGNKRGIVDVDREDDDRRGLLAHVSGLSPIVSLNRAGS